MDMQAGKMLVSGRTGGAVPARRPLRAALLALAVSVPALTMGGCAAVYDPQGFATAMAPGNGQPQADAALAALARGDYSRAEREAAAALARDARNPYALLAAGVTFQNTARPARARQMYEEILALDTSAEVSGPWWGTQPRPVAEIAAENLRILSGTAAGPASLVAAAADPEASPVGAEALPLAAERFVVLRRLRDDGLITGEEYARRRAANLGALLPMSEQPPAAGLDTPSPGAQEVLSRLRALREAFESRNITAAEHTAERSMILDGLLPAAPRTRAVPPLPPAGVMDAAARVGVLQRLRDMDLITAAEFAREKAAIEKAIRPVAAADSRRSATATPPARKPAAAAQGASTPTTLVPATGTGNPAATLRSGRVPLEVVPSPAPGNDDTGPGDGAVLSAAQGGTILQQPRKAPAATTAEAAASPRPAGPESDARGPVSLHLASFRSEERARRGWEELQARHPELKGLKPQVTRVDLPGQGTFFRLLAGPVADRATADRLCKTLQAQYCKAVFAAS